MLVPPARLQLALLDPQVARELDITVRLIVAMTLALAAGSEITVDTGEIAIY